MKQKITLFILFVNFISLSYSQEKIIDSGDEWKYYDLGNLANNWAKNSNFNNWKTGNSPIGYGDKKNSTNINFGVSKENKDITKYFSKEFFLESPLDYIAYEIKMQRDDGVVIYLNGEELYRDNMPKGVITANTTSKYSIQSSAESIFISKIIDSKKFKKGKNTLSASVHQSRAGSSDCIFNLQLLAHDNPRVLSVLLDEKTDSNNQLENQLKNLSNQFEIKNAGIQIELLKNTNENYRFLLFVISFLLIIAFISLYLLVNKYRKNEESHNSEIIHLNKQVFDKDREMMILSTQLLHYKQHLKEIKSELKHIETKQNNTLKSIIQQIDFITENNDEWSNFKKHFNTVFTGFYDNLIEIHANLTEVELRHCMFIKLHMQTKEIAKILNVDPRSVQASRYRIKKKMNLDEETDLRNYIVSIV